MKERLCDACRFLMIEAPVNRYDVWRALCCDKDKPVPGARRVVATASARSETGPVRIETPVWCRGNAKKEAAAVKTTPRRQG